jgi:hypothetical protein
MVLVVYGFSSMVHALQVGLRLSCVLLIGVFRGQIVKLMPILKGLAT